MKLIGLISKVNNEFCDSLKEMFRIIGTTAFGIADKTFPIAVIVRLTQMISKIVGTGEELNNEIKKDLNEINSLSSGISSEEVLSHNSLMDQVDRTTNAANEAAEIAVTKNNNNVNKSTILPVATTSPTLQVGGLNKKINKKQYNQSLKKKYLFNHKTLKIKNRLHKLLLS
jgi:hypothetical protein